MTKGWIIMAIEAESSKTIILPNIIGMIYYSCLLELSSQEILENRSCKLTLQQQMNHKINSTTLNEIHI